MKGTLMPDGGVIFSPLHQQLEQQQQYISEVVNSQQQQQQQQQDHGSMNQSQNLNQTSENNASNNNDSNNESNNSNIDEGIGEGEGGGPGGGGGGQSGPGNNSSVIILTDPQQQQQQQQFHQEQQQVCPDRRDFFEEIRNGGGHWSQLLRQVVFSPPQQNNGDNQQQQSALSQQQQDESSGSGENVDGDGSNPVIPVQFLGGSENGQFAYIGSLNPDVNQWIAIGYLQVGDIILDIQGQQVAGYTQADVLSLLHHCLQSSVTLTVAPRGSLGPDLRSYLNTRFQKGSVDHALQGVVRDNLYLRTVPVTTRTPRQGEIPGVDYTFLSVEEFMELERNGSLLESGVYAGNHYGTPKPWASGLRAVQLQQSNANDGGSGQDRKILPGMHPSSEGKRRRNRSNVEALGAGDDDPPPPPTANSSNPPPVTYTSRVPPSDELGPLPENWEMAYTEKGEVYFIDHNTGTSHWLDPRLSRIQKNSLEECTENELPFGWEKIEDPHYGTYYIDHVNRRTQFENPVIQAKQTTPTKGGGGGSGGGGGGEGKEEKKSQPPHPNPKPNISRQIYQQQMDLDGSGMRSKSNRFFTRDPTQLIGERIATTLVKSSRGLGFTIVGGDDDDGLDEFLQIKSVVADGPAWRDSKLRTGDVLVRVNGRCVLGYTHQEMVSIFQSIAPGEDVHLEVCRGYPLPFDPADPNTEIVTTVAVAPLSQTDGSNLDKRHQQLDHWGRSSPANSAHSLHSLPELSAEHSGYKSVRPASVDLLLDSPAPNNDNKSSGLSKHNMEPGIFLTVGIVKGNTGFGFTIADSVAGQKVKKVLDSSHCGGLQEGDRLIAIDGIDLRGLSHTQVVQILKDFPLGKEATLTIQRIHSQQQQPPPFSIKFNTATNHYSDSRLLNLRPGVSPRSKTPTAGDMGRGVTRDSLPERSKTPLVESGANNGGMNGELNGEYPYYNPETGMPGEMDSSGVPLIRDWIEMTIELQRRQEGFGFRIVGGTEEGSQVSVGHIVPRGAASLDGRLQTNDHIIAVDGISVIGSSHHSVVQLMARSASLGRVSLTIRRPVYGVAPHSEYISSPAGSPAGLQPLHVLLRRAPTEGFGFVIISSASKAGATIGRIVESSPADRCGQLHVGDRILAVNQIDISQLHHSQVVQLIKESGLSLTLSVLPVGLNGSLQGSGPYSGNMLANDLENMSLKDSGYDMGTAFISPESHPINFNNSDNYNESLEQVFSVGLSRGVRGFGFSIRGGKEFQNMPLFVLRLAEDGPATMDGRMQVGDQILQINGISTQGMTHSQAIHLIKTGGTNVHLLLRRGAVPFPFLSQMPNAFTAGLNGGHTMDEEQSLTSSNNDQSLAQQPQPHYLMGQLSDSPLRAQGYPPQV